MTSGGSPAHDDAVTGGGWRSASPWERILYALTFALAAVWIVRLGREAAGATFGTDECFHAWVSAWIGAHGRLPDVIPGLYGGFAYAYPPLLHLVGAIASVASGAPGLHLLPLLLAAGTLPVIAFGAPGAIPGRARAWAILTCLASGLFATYAVRLYAEGLTALVVTAGGLAFVHQQRAGGRIATLVLGVLAGLAILAKFSGWALVVLIAAAALVRLVRGEAASARALGLALAIALLIAAPWLVRNQILFGSALYPLGAPDVDPVLMALHRARFSTPPAVFLAGLGQVLGPVLAALLAMAVFGVFVERRWTVRESVWAFAIAGIVGTAFAPVAAPRHLVAFVPLLALASAWIVAGSFAGRRIPSAPVGAVLALVAAWTLVRFPDHRTGASPPPPLMDAFAAVERVTPEGATVLSLWTYDTFYYAHRAATWPVPWGQRVSPAALFQTRDPVVFAAQLDSLGIGYVLAPQAAPLEPWNGSNYPEAFIGCVRTLVETGQLRMAWQSDRFVLLGRE